MQEKGSSYLVRFNQLTHENDSAYHRAATRLGLSDTAFWILYLIRSSGHDLTQKEISGFFFLPKQTVHSALRGFLEQGILELRPEAGRRDKSIHVTPKGDRFLRATVDQVLAVERGVFSRVAEEEMEQFLRTWRAISDRLNMELARVAAPEQLEEEALTK